MDFIESCYDFLLLSSPFLLLGFSISALIYCFLPLNLIKKYLGRHKLSDVTYASLIGVPLPLCSCSVLPTAITLKKSGATNAATASFIISTPETGVDSISLTYALMDLPMTIIRPVAAFFSAWTAGILNFCFNKEEKTVKVEAKKSCCAHPEQHDGMPNISSKKSMATRLKESFRYAFVDLVDDMAGSLVLGLFVGACISFFVPNNFFENINPITAKLLFCVVGVPLYICASAATPIAASLIMKGISPGTALILLLVGPATNVANIMVIKDYIGKKGVILNIISIIGVALIFSFLTDYFYATYLDGVVNFKLHAHHHEHGETVNWFNTISAWIIIVLLAQSLFRINILSRLKKGSSSCH
jgi:uncharacterized membrane protein YraQ (UPF0718 family)